MEIVEPFERETREEKIDRLAYDLQKRMDEQGEWMNEIMNALTRLLRATDPFAPMRGTEDELNARAAAVRSLVPPKRRLTTKAAGEDGG